MEITGGEERTQETGLSRGLISNLFDYCRPLVATIKVGRYGVHAVTYLKAAQQHAHRPVKQAVISASALSLLYPQNGVVGYSSEAFLDDLVDEAERDIRECLTAGAACVQIDFTEGRLALKLDPSGGVLNAFIELNNRVLDRFNATERQRIEVHTCPGGDHDSTHSADVDYTVLPGLVCEFFRNL
jgi:methionine synthase II (cobalamin-independent)